jgi:hypothetical protein
MLPKSSPELCGGLLVQMFRANALPLGSRAVLKLERRNLFSVLLVTLGFAKMLKQHFGHKWQRHSRRRPLKDLVSIHFAILRDALD